MFRAVSIALVLAFATAVVAQIFPVTLVEVDVVPTQCNSTCTPAANVTSMGCTVIACCTEAFQDAYFECLSCVGEALNVTDYGPAQHIIDTLTAACGVRQFDLPNRTFPGEDPDRVIATSSLLASASDALLPSGTGQLTVTESPLTSTSDTPQGTITAPGEPEPTDDDGGESSGPKSAIPLSVLGAGLLQILMWYAMA